MDFAGKTFLVVGGSGVLGSELVNQLAAKGARVFATCRSQESSVGIPNAAQLKLIVDLTNPDSIQILADYLLANHKLDGVVIASGRVGFGGARDTQAADAQALTQINYLGPADLITRLLPALEQGANPVLAAITGIVAEKTFPGMHAYSASKAALASWLDSLRLEVRKSGIRVIDARPGHTETGLATRPLFGVAPNMPSGMDPAKVAARIIQALEGTEAVLDSSVF